MCAHILVSCRDYAPSGGNLCSGEKEDFDEGALVFLGEPEGIKIGSKWVHCCAVLLPCTSLPMGSCHACGMQRCLYCCLLSTSNT